MWFIVEGTRSRTKSIKESRTFHSRHEHYNAFINKMKLNDSYALVGFSQEIRNLLISSYTVTPTLGHTLRCMFIKADTIGKYLNPSEELSIPYKIIIPFLNFMSKIFYLPKQSSKNQKDEKKCQIEKNR